MGDLFDLVDIQVIQGGLIQLDLKNYKTNQSIRTFLDPKELFSKIGESMSRNMDEWLNNFQKEQ